MKSRYYIFIVLFLIYTVSLSSASLTNEYKYIVYYENGTYFAENQQTGNIDYQGVNKYSVTGKAVQSTDSGFILCTGFRLYPQYIEPYFKSDRVTITNYHDGIIRYFSLYGHRNGSDNVTTDKPVMIFQALTNTSKPILEWRRETFESELCNYNVAEKTGRGEKIYKVIRLEFADGGAPLDIGQLPESGNVEDIKPWGRTSDVARLIAVIQSKGLKVKFGKGLTTFQVIPSILGSTVRMNANPREYMGDDGETKTAINWTMDFVKINDAAKDCDVKGFVSAPNAPPVPEKKDDIIQLETVKGMILKFLESVKLENPEQWKATNEIVKFMRLELKDEKLIAGYSKLREQALKELVEVDCMIEKDANMYRLM